MLAGVGGSTIEEAKRRLSVAETRAWRAYFDSRGTPNIGLRLEYLLAQLVKQVLTGMAGKSVDLGALQPHLRRQSETEAGGEMSFEAYAASMGATVRVRDGG